MTPMNEGSSVAVRISLRALGLLVFVNFLYACTSIFTKMASGQEMMSWPWLLWIAGAMGVMGLYALGWQQVLKRIDLSTAYLFKGTSLVFVLLISYLLFGEAITLKNILGAAFIIAGIILYAKA